MKKLHSPSIILEWETVQEGGLARGLAGLRAIREQLAQLAPTFDRTAEVIVCYEAAVIAEEDLRALVRQAAEGGEWPCAVVLSAVPKGANYYEKKNVGARLATNEVLLFFDTDLLADPGWLEGMLVPFQKWEVSVVVGATYLDHARLYDMAVALFWIFRPTMPAAPLHPTRSLLSNNLAVRRPLFLRFLFPDRPIYRGQCTELGLQMMQAGLTMYEQTGARARHPPPPGERFVQRAWLAGQNEQFYHALYEESSAATDWQQLRTDYRNVAQRIRERSMVLRPSRSEKMLAWGLGLSYYAIKAVGYMAAHLQVKRGEPASPVRS